MFKTQLASFALLLLGTLILSVSAHAMEIQKFDMMATSDQSEYIVVLIEGAQKVLIDEGKRDLEDKVHTLFTEVREGDKITTGMEEFETYLARVRVLDAERYAKDHNAQRLEVEHTMILTLKKNGIVLPRSFMTVGKDFKPKNRPKEEKK